MKSSIRETYIRVTISGLITNEQLMDRNIKIDDKLSIKKQTYPAVVH